MRQETNSERRDEDRAISVKITSAILHYSDTLRVAFVDRIRQLIMPSKAGLSPNSMEFGHG